jgi:RNA-directed DNA polymerase
LCVYRNGLPQGGPCSPKLSNLSAWGLDTRIQGYVGRRTITYTRYADDMSFSGQNVIKLVKLISFLEKIIKDQGLELNHSKTRVAGLNRAKTITGLVLAEDKIGVGKKTYKNIRAKIHHLTKITDLSNLKAVYHVNGWLAYLKSVDNTRYQRACNYVRNLQTKYPQTIIQMVVIPHIKIAEITTTVEIV